MTTTGRILQSPKLELLCDTGAQVDCLNVRSLRLLGLSPEELLQPEVGVGCANETSADVLGVFFAKVSAMEVGKGGKKTEVKVLVYVLRKGGDMLSRHACERMGLISPEFPYPGEHFRGQPDRRKVCAVEGKVYQEVGVCDPDSPLPCRCPRREYVDPPVHLPFAPTKENREKLE